MRRPKYLSNCNGSAECMLVEYLMKRHISRESSLSHTLKRAIHILNKIPSLVSQSSAFLLLSSRYSSQFFLDFS